MLREQVGAERTAWKRKTSGPGVEETGVEATGDPGAARSAGHNCGPAQKG